MASFIDVWRLFTGHTGPEKPQKERKKDRKKERKMSLKDRRRCAKFYFDHFYQIWRRGEPSEEVGLDGLKIGKLPPLSPLSRNHEKNIIVVSNFVRSIFRSFQKEILSLFEFHFQ